MHCPPGPLAPCPHRRLASLARTLILALLLSAVASGSALASTDQIAMFEDTSALVADPVATLASYRLLGVQNVRVDVRWPAIAPRPLSRKRPRGFNPANPAAYPAAGWHAYDTIARTAKADGIELNFDLGGSAPLWATGPGAPRDKPHPNWDPSPGEFGSFVRAVGTRYSGSYVPRGSSAPLPRVHFWSVWNEPNLGYELAPQGVPGHLKVENSGRMYRNLLDQSWAALHQTGHGRDTVLIDELAPRGDNYFGVFSSMKPLVFLRALYCVDSRYRQLRGSAAAMRGCPANASGSRRFRSAHPALFEASAVSDHLYMRWYPPNKEAQPDANYSSLAEIGGLERTLDRLQRSYGSGKRYRIYNTEFGYITAPPNRRPFVSPRTAAYYLNWSEYISWRDPRIASFDQYQLRDPTPTASNLGGWSTGLLTYHGAQKPAYDAWRLPLYLPVTSTRRGRSLEVWGCARPAYFARTDAGGGPQSVQLEFQAGSRGAFTALATVPVTNRYGYFDLRVKFPSSGTARLEYRYPAKGPLFPESQTVRSRDVRVTLS